MNSEVIIVKNPFFYQHLSPDAFQTLMKDGSWIPLVFQSVETVVNRYFLELCELDWDYCRETDNFEKTHSLYKSIYYKELNDEQRRFIEKVADEIEREIVGAAQECVAAKSDEEME